MSWELDGRIGNIRLNQLRRHGMAFMRDKERGLIAFYTLPLAMSLYPMNDEPPRPEQYIVAVEEFIPN